MIAHRQPGLGAALSVAAVATLAGVTAAAAQSGSAGRAPDRVLAFPAPVGEERLDVDRGAMGAWHRIRKLATTASLLHVTAHPDDEHAGMLTLASRGWGARTALLSLNRGEAGANAIGPELFDALGLIRTRELVLSGRYYGLDDLYFTTAVDYGYSKSVDEAFRSWDREAVLEDMVRVIRLNRPLVVVSRFHGSARDGHGHHHAAGLLTPEAVAGAADPARFPRQISEEGLRPWRVLRTFRGGVRVDEPYDVEVDATGMSPWLGDTYQRWASRGLGLQRSQTAGRVRTGGGRYFYEQLGGAGDGAAAAAGIAESFFAGLDATLRGLPALLDEPASPEADSLLAELDRLIGAVAETFDFRDPGRAVADLARGLGWIRAAIAALPDSPETRFHLTLKERQFEEALLAASGTTVSAELARGPGVGGEAVLAPGQTAAVQVRVEPPASAESGGVTAWIVSRDGETLAPPDRVVPRPDGSTEALEVRVPATPAAPYFGRGDVSENHYQVSDSADLHLPWRRPALAAGVELAIAGHVIAHTVPVTAPVARLPYGAVTRRVETLPVLSVSLAPDVGIVPVGGAGGDDDAGGGGGSPAAPPAAPMEVRARVVANAAPLSATVRLELPEGWTTAPGTPGVVEHDFRTPGEIVDAAFVVTPPAGWRGEAEIAAVARARGVDYRRGYRTSEHRDLPLARLWRPARIPVRSVPVTRLDGVRVGYVMGVGDEVPAGIEALGATVELLDEAALAELDPAAGADSADEPGFHAIVVGTRAYAVREDLIEHNRRLLEYARRGGHLIVLYQTQEYVPSEMAPYPASLPRGAEEVSEEDAPVRLLRPDHPLMTAPNRIAEADFDGWIEQRGSKFFTEWDPAYTPLVETHDTGQAPQEGVWLTAPVGEGRYTYLALALHRQLPYGVPGAYRILSNVISWR
ncbi:PIG-L family deacetylase [Candidatus Palauibacter soopunensis]|uniref:PIG-L family deacetylase n=1 Tax=Candidatus Palauibacter soopunensis TaxID=3056739 RepID=UPI00239BA83B|nr:PIG-L family deacetylase [Candidatus Palauibacter soopunensis]MDE2877679.1 PIG-L family deacetylase [Candidatus Palauibacter soopunensis]